MEIDTFILIGGRSSRFGSDKAFVEFEGEMLASRIARIATAALSSKRVTYVAADAKQFLDDSLNALGHPVICDEKPGFGVWSGVHVALQNAQSEWIFLCACDLPLISEEFLKLAASFIADDIDAVIPRQPDGRVQPLCAFYRAKPAMTFVDKIFTADATPPFTSISRQPKSRIIEPAEYQHLAEAEKLFTNVNTVADL